MMDEPKKVIVHGVYNGKALCGLIRRAGGEWPRDHDGVVYTKIVEITCIVCQEAARTLAEQEAGP